MTWENVLKDVNYSRYNPKSSLPADEIKAIVQNIPPDVLQDHVALLLNPAKHLRKNKINSRQHFLEN